MRTAPASELRSAAFVVCWLLAALGVLFVQTARAAGSAKSAVEPTSFPSAVSRAIERAGAAGTAAGICIVSVPDGRALFSQNADQLYVVASNEKLVITAAALAELGPDFQFVTTLSTRGKIRKGVLQGDLVLFGRGDPNLSGRFFDGDALAVMRQWIYAVRQAGITEVRGDVIADDRAFDRQYIHPDWPPGQLPYWYCAQVAALSFNDNCVEITVRPGRAGGAPVQLSLSPPTGFVQLLNECTTGGKSSSVSLARSPGTNAISVRGTFPPGADAGVLSATIHNPPLYLGHVFLEQLKAHGIQVSGNARLPREGEDLTKSLKLLARTATSLSTTIRVANRRSQNFYAEQIFKTLGLEKKGQGSFGGGVAAVEEFLGTLGIQRGSYSARDGSGMSRNNRFTPAQIVAILQHMYRHRYARVYLDSLPLRYQKEPAVGSGALSEGRRGCVLAKTGTLDGARCLSGYAFTMDARPFAFSILCNSALPGAERRLQSDIAKAIVEYAR